MSSLSRLTCQASGLPSQEQGVKYVVDSDTSGRTNVKSRDIVSISMSRGSLRVGGSFLDFACVGVNGGDVVVDADEHDFFGAVFSSDVEFAHVAGPAEGA